MAYSAGYTLLGFIREQGSGGASYVKETDTSLGGTGQNMVSINLYAGLRGSATSQPFPYERSEISALLGLPTRRRHRLCSVELGVMMGERVPLHWALTGQEARGNEREKRRNT